MVLGEVAEEHHQRFGPPGNGGRSQRRADRGHVAEHLGAYVRLGDLGGPLCRGPGGRPLARRDGHRAKLITGVAQREQAPGEMLPGRWRRAGQAVELGEHRVEVVVSYLLDLLAQVQAETRGGQPGHLAGPVRAPPQRFRGSLKRTDVIGEAGRPGCGQIDAGRLGQQQLQVRPHVTLGEAPGHERPRIGAVKISQPRRRRPAHPPGQIRMLPQEQAGAAAPVIPRPVPSRQSGNVDVVIGEQAGRGARPGPDGGRRGVHHGDAFLAAAYSAASVSADRCTYRPVVCGLT